MRASLLVEDALQLRTSSKKDNYLVLEYNYNTVLSFGCLDRVVLRVVLRRLSGLRQRTALVRS